ncbi:hypothetical protein, partial [Salmonella enterica]|uniref:hypothetical protein n=1 Tax=Salmonella enterica TaxID=28901 RepID=UPI001561D7D2
GPGRRLPPPFSTAYGEAGRVAWHLTPLIARLWGSWSRSVAFNPLNRQAMEECWSRTMAFNPLNRQAMG